MLSHIILIGAQLSFSEFQLPNQLKPLIGYPVKPWELDVLVRSWYCNFDEVNAENYIAGKIVAG